MDIFIYPWIPQNTWIDRLTDIYADMEMAWISQLSDEMDTNIILSAFMDIHLHPRSSLMWQWYQVKWAFISLIKIRSNDEDAQAHIYHAQLGLEISRVE